jgi:chemotaxis protein MotB
LQRVQLELAQAIAAGEEKGADLDALRAEIEAIQSEGRSGLEGLEAQLAAALAAKLALEQENADVLKQLQDAVAARLAADALAQTRLDESVERDILLQQAKQELAEASVLTAAQAEDIQKAERQTALLNQQVTELRKQLQQLQLVLEQSEEKDRDAQVQLTNMGNRLNAALARAATEERKRRLLEEAERKRLEEERNKLASRAEDLARYKSDFFGALRDIVEGQEGVRIVGDRFVFSSEVLFDAGAAELSDAGRDEIAKVADILRAIMKDIPEGIDWVIRVDGHTDDRPLSGLGEFSDNWELSQARALSVVKFMISDLGVPADRLAANGFGEFQPVNPAQTREARAQNRRIELKLTER